MATTGPERMRDHLEGSSVLGLGLEIAYSAIIEVHDDVERVVELDLTQVGLDERGVQRLGFGSFFGNLDVCLQQLHADHGESPTRQLKRMPARATAEIQDSLMPERPEHRYQPIDFRNRLVRPWQLVHLRRIGRSIPILLDFRLGHGRPIVFKWSDKSQLFFPVEMRSLPRTPKPPAPATPPHARPHAPASPRSTARVRTPVPPPR